MSDTEVIDAGGTPALSADEEAFFSSGGEKSIPDEGGADAGAGKGGEAKPAGGEAKPGDTPKNDHVPLATFLEEKKARKELSGKLTEYEKQIAEFKGKFAIIDRLKFAGETEPTTPAGPPNPEEDIFGAVKHVGETVAQMQKRLDDAAKATADAEKAAADEKVFVGKYRAACDEFESTNSDFKAAYNFLLNSRAADLKAIGYDTPQALHNALIADEFAIAQMAFEKGKSPAELIYNLANSRGYKKEAAADPNKGKAAEKLEAIERGQAANKSLSNAGGSSGDPEMTAEALIAMPADEFEAWTNKNPAKARRLFGG
ncbi:hypothetical protein IVB46_09615 [Bradyrhizobium sp. 61]|uniref:hypothetical protein n=1 Tax=Bradyrhizobium sp. 61 TaxID=2782679 RepID=UPI001FF7270E|nr:hypothetical protein [Bradyrhizobium sp. 61]MCK1275485.1 hypothetical protein [Bradyrhizobium sp. 61]